MRRYPLVKQLRNPHNYFKDHMAERLGLELTETFCMWLRSIPLQGTTYLACLEEIIAGLEAHCAASPVAQKNEEFQGIVAGFCEQRPAPPMRCRVTDETDHVSCD